MSDTLFDIPETVPRWREFADLHGITCHRTESHYLPPVYIAELEWFGRTETDQAETEREAVIALIHRLKLSQWETVSIA
jgi:hypothetical protein